MICQRHPMNRIQRIHQKMRIDLIHQLSQLQICFFFFLPLLTLNQLLNLRFHLIERCKKLIVFRKLNRCLCLRKISFSKMAHFFFQYFDRMRYQPDLWNCDYGKNGQWNKNHASCQQGPLINFALVFISWKQQNRIKSIDILFGNSLISVLLYSAILIQFKDISFCKCFLAGILYFLFRIQL